MLQSLPPPGYQDDDRAHEAQVDLKDADAEEGDEISRLINQATRRDDVPPTDIRRIMSQAKAKRPPTKTSRVASVHEMVPTHHVPTNLSGKLPSRSLVDRGANGGIAGDNVRVIAEVDRHVNVQGVGNHELSDLKIVTAGGVCPSHRGDVLVILHQYALIPGSQTIHSSTQMEQFGLNVDDRAVAHGGSQTITTDDDYTLPLDFVNGLPYLPIRPFTDLEWDTLPHLCLTSDVEWDPNSLNHVISGNNGRFDPGVNRYVPTLCHLTDGTIQDDLTVNHHHTTLSACDFDKYQGHIIDAPVSTVEVPCKKYNPSNILNKVWGYASACRPMMEMLLFWEGDTLGIE